MKYNFESKKRESSRKWEMMYDINNNIDDGVMPLTVADMEFECAPQIYENLEKWISEKPILGYVMPTDGFKKATVNWLKNKHNFSIDENWLVQLPSVVPSFYTAINAFTNIGDGVIIFTPTYPPFKNSIIHCDRKVIDVSLIEKNGRYEIDFEKFEIEAAKQNNKLLFLCNPHNPTGRVWNVEELNKISEIAIKYNLIVLSDEIWNDVINPDYKHITLSSLSKDISDRCITIISASKMFNLAGICVANAIISNEELREKFREQAFKLHFVNLNFIGFKITEYAYNFCDEWRNEALELIFENQKFVHNFFKENMPLIDAKISEGTYLMWIDFRKYGLEQEDLMSKLYEKQFFVKDGMDFGENGKGFVRMNVAIPRKNLEIILNKLKDIKLV